MLLKRWAKITLPISIFATLGLLHTGVSEPYSCFSLLYIHFLSSSGSQGETSSQHSDVTRKAIKQELLEVFLCNNNISHLPPEIGIYFISTTSYETERPDLTELGYPFGSIYHYRNNFSLVSSPKSLFRKYSGFEANNRRGSCLCAFTENNVPCRLKFEAAMGFVVVVL